MSTPADKPNYQELQLADEIQAYTDLLSSVQHLLSLAIHVMTQNPPMAGPDIRAIQNACVTLGRVRVTLWGVCADLSTEYNQLTEKNGGS